MDLVVIGAGRAGGSLARAATAAGHRVVGMLTRRPQHDHPALDWDEPLPGCDLVLVAVSDGAITDVAERLAPRWNPETPAVHVSGFMPVSALAPIAARGAAVGSFHPLQTLPDPERGAAALAGAWAAVTAAEPLAGLLEELARSLGMRPSPWPTKPSRSTTPPRPRRRTMWWRRWGWPPTSSPPPAWTWR